MSIPSFVIDAFTSTLFSGNQAAVCILQEHKHDHWLQRVAAEFNLSETAFLRQLDNNHWHLRWFTPTCEIKLCGHATLASAHVLLNELKYDYDEIIFSTLSGDLYAYVEADKIKLDFPRTAISRITEHRVDIAALGLKPIASYTAGENILIELASADDVQNYQPDFNKIAAVHAPGVIITAANIKPTSNDGIDFVSRFFAPNIGINEDPVTGSAHCALASLWSEKLGKTSLRAKQVSARTGILDIVCHETRVDLIGSCVTFLKGNIA